MTDTIVNHRTLVGEQRRQKMTRKLIESALVVFSEKGIDASVIDDVIKQAGVSRGTFYNYFKTNTELLEAASSALADELVDAIENVVGQWDNPVERIATGIRLFLNFAKIYPTLANFVWRAGFNAANSKFLFYDYLPRHIVESKAQGLPEIKDVETTLELIMGTVLAACFGIAARKVPSNYPEGMVSHLLLGFGLSIEETDRLMSLSFDDLHLPEDSILVTIDSLSK